MGAILDQIIGWAVGAILACLDAVFGLITNVLLTTPQVTGLPQVQALTGRSVWVVDTAFVLAFVAAGALTMAAGGDTRSRYAVKDLLPRLVVGFVAAHFSQLFCARLIELANAVTAAISDTGTGGPGALDAIKLHLASGRDRTVPLLFLILAVLITVLVAATAFQMVARFIALLVMTMIAPLALACHALPATDQLARLWWRSYAGCLLVPVAQAFFLTAGQWMLLDPKQMLPVLGLPVDPGGVMNLLVVVVLLWTTVKIPGLMGRWVGQTGRGNADVLGAVVRIAVTQQLGRVPAFHTLRRATK